ncbi:MAG: hypothetical protein EBR88_08210, partial [Betaproteobacteria bacterium]|nr:hypothetical protein [Betaproteobacteria bacterium]
MTKSELIVRLTERLNNPLLGVNAQLVQKDCEVSVRLLLDAVPPPTRLIAELMYGGGLRVGELV